MSVALIVACTIRSLQGSETITIAAQSLYKLILDIYSLLRVVGNRYGLRKKLLNEYNR